MTYTMLARLDEVVGAIERDDGSCSFDLRALSAKQFADAMTPTRSKTAAGKLGMVTRAAFGKDGRAMGNVTLP